MEGSCLCEGVKFTVNGLPEKVLACYCTHCAKGAGAPGQQLAKYGRESVKVQQGGDLMQTFTLNDTTSGSAKHKVFCRVCACTLWTIPMHHGGTLLMVRTALLDNGLETLLPEAELFGSRNTKALEAAAALRAKTSI